MLTDLLAKAHTSVKKRHQYEARNIIKKAYKNLKLRNLPKEPQETIDKVARIEEDSLWLNNNYYTYQLTSIASFAAFIQVSKALQTKKNCQANPSKVVQHEKKIDQYFSLLQKTITSAPDLPKRLFQHKYVHTLHTNIIPQTALAYQDLTAADKKVIKKYIDQTDTNYTQTLELLSKRHSLDLFFHRTINMDPDTLAYFIAMTRSQHDSILNKVYNIQNTVANHITQLDGVHEALNLGDDFTYPGSELDNARLATFYANEGLILYRHINQPGIEDRFERVKERFIEAFTQHPKDRIIHRKASLFYNKNF